MSGSAIPYFILGNRIGLWLNLLPFSGTISIPIQILLGKYSVILSLRYICVQLLWSLVFGVITLLSYQKVIKRVVVQEDDFVEKKRLFYLSLGKAYIRIGFQI